MPKMKSDEYWRGKPGAQYGIWNDVKNRIATYEVIGNTYDGEDVNGD